MTPLRSTMKNNPKLALTVCATLLSTGLYAKSMDPVSQDEIDIAKQLATAASTSAASVAARSTVSAAQSSDSADSSASEPEFLRVETHRFGKGDVNSGQRWADVTTYDYSTDELIITVVDLESSAIMSTTRHKEMQPPLSQAELTRALTIVFDDPEERSILDAEYKRITGETLTSVDQLQYKAFTFFADSMPTVVNAASESCGVQRCAQLMLYTHDNLVFEVSPIVNLSAGVVTQRMGY